ncbi:hypothetical protein R2F61_01755 [Mollicutes bacterium LVI A0078]|nr:hypothetical protein RZE84_01750 [Mollicutes bacterium LVI A0075]WOO91300.1 hypothetical protein R2F61_01755 [Mollicutes bacterium LVI A0078]
MSNSKIFYDRNKTKSFMGKFSLFGQVGTTLQHLVRLVISIALLLLSELILGYESGVTMLLSFAFMFLGLIFGISLIRLLLSILFAPVITVKQSYELLNFIRTRKVVIDGQEYDI